MDEQNVTVSADLLPDRDYLLPTVKSKPQRTGNALLYIAAFFVPLLIMWLIYIAMEVYPFGTNSVLVLDLNGQYVYFFAELREKLLEGGSLLYSWSRALGGEFMGIFAYYLASPFSLLVALFPANMITEALLTIILLKVGSCGLTMAIYLRKTHPTSRLNTVIFSTMYALCAYAVVQAHNTMWIDEMIFLPLVILGVERLITRRECILYTASIAFCMMTNFYIGYMVCIFTFFYFFVWYFAHNANRENNLYEENHHFLRSLLRIGIFSLIAVAMAMVILYPAYYSLTFGKTTFSNPNYSFSQNFDFLDMLAKLFPGSYDTVRPEGLPFIYCGIPTLLLLPLYFLSDEIRPREKMLIGALMVLLVVSFNGSTIDLIWHGFQRPNWLNYRYSFCLVFLMIYCAYRAFETLNRAKYRYMLGVVAVLAILLLVIQKQEYEWLNDLSCIWLSLALLLVYACIFSPICRGYMKHTGKMILMIAVCFEMFAAGLFHTISLDEDVVISRRNTYVDYIEKLQPVVDALKQYESEHENLLFYRMEKSTHRKTNDIMALDMNGISNSTSTLNASVISTLADFGYASKSHWSKYLGDTPVADSLLGIRYVIRTNQEESIYEYVLGDEEKELYGYLNPWALSLAYAVDDAVLDFDAEEYNTPFEYMNHLITAMLGEEKTIQVFRPVTGVTTTMSNLELAYTSGHKRYTPITSGKAATLTFSFDMQTDGELYCYFPSTWKREVALKLNGVSHGTYFANETYRIVSLGDYDKGSGITLDMTLNDKNLYIENGLNYFYVLDREVFEDVMTRLAASNMTITAASDTEISGTITLSDDRLLFTTIPYDEGWHVWVDGEAVEIEKTLGSMLAVPLSGGTHTVEFRYMSRAFAVGLCVSILGFTAFAVSIAIYVARRRKKGKSQTVQINIGDNT